MNGGALANDPMCAEAALESREPSPGSWLDTAEQPVRAALDRAQRAIVIRHTLAAMDRMGLDEAQKLALLGLSPRARASLHRYRTGSSVPEAADQLERCANLLRIAVALDQLFPEGAGYWLEAKPAAFGDRTLLALMQDSFEGLIRARRMIEAELQR
jgi:hypothetical protein